MEWINKNMDFVPTQQKVTSFIWTVDIIFNDTAFC